MARPDLCDSAFLEMALRARQNGDDAAFAGYLAAISDEALARIGGLLIAVVTGTCPNCNPATAWQPPTPHQARH